MLWIITNVNRTVFHASESPDSLIGRGERGPRLTEAMRGLASEAVKPFVQGWAVSAVEFTHEFLLLDDDGLVYLEGVCGDLTDCEADLAFAPLDWAKPRWGCTTLMFRVKGSKSDWDQL